MLKTEVVAHLMKNLLYNLRYTSGNQWMDKPTSLVFRNGKNENNFNNYRFNSDL
jgi:hypothetical protein